MKTSIDELDLSPRASNCLKRAGLTTIGDLVNSIDKQDDLLKYRNLGENSASEIMRKLFFYHHDHLKEKQKATYHKKVAALNGREEFLDCFISGGRFDDVRY